jgi:hypothetical protein
MTNGFFRPATAKTNATSLCGKGRLTAEVELKVCAPVASAVHAGIPATVAPAPEPVLVPIAMQVAAPVSVIAVAQRQDSPIAADGSSSESLGAAAARNKKHKACLKLAANNPNLEMTCNK